MQLLNISRGHHNGYLKRTSQWRMENKATQLFLSTLKPHNPVSRDTIARWLKQTLYAAGINTDTFTAHSTRSASSSKANMQGAKFEEILNRGSKSSTWQNHYRREVVSKEDSGKFSGTCIIRFEQRKD